MKNAKLFAVLATLSLFVVWSVQAVVVESDCHQLPNTPAVAAVQVADEDPAVKNDYDEMVEEDMREGVVYLTVVNGATPTPSPCGLNASNDPGAWAGWGGPLDGDNVTIGEGPGTRNEIVIGGVYFPRGIGTHGTATFAYDLTGGNYVMLQAYVGMSDEKDPADCGAGGTSDFTFTIDGAEMFKSDTLAGTVDGENVAPLYVEFEIPAGSQELVIEIGDGGDGNGCDHSAIGDAKLLTSAVAVEPTGKLATSWASLKTVR